MYKIGAYIATIVEVRTPRHARMIGRYCKPLVGWGSIDFHIQQDDGTFYKGFDWDTTLAASHEFFTLPKLHEWGV